MNICESCGQQFRVGHGASGRLKCYKCSPSRVKRPTRALTRICKCCEKEFKTESYNVKFCSAYCRTNVIRISKQKEREKALEELKTIGKVCILCKERKPSEDFGNDRKRLDGKFPHCRDCRREYQGQTKHVPPKQTRTEYMKEYWSSLTEEEKRRRGRNHHLLTNYGIDYEAYKTMLAAQGNHCAICSKTSNGTEQKPDRLFCVDHDHKCCPGKVTCGKCIRGLLCTPCNQGLGSFNDNKEFLKKALDYL